MTADTTVLALTSLFARHGAPLVLKSDNGSAFCAEATANFLGESAVIPLFSPPGRPSYNGACEAGIGSLKCRSECQAAWQSRPGSWTWDDVELARLDANASARPRGPTPDQAWASRPILPDAQRQAFAATLARRRAEVCQDQGQTFAALIEHGERSQADRIAIQRALVEHDYLLFTRRRIPARIGV